MGLTIIELNTEIKYLMEFGEQCATFRLSWRVAQLVSQVVDQVNLNLY